MSGTFCVPLFFFSPRQFQFPRASIEKVRNRLWKERSRRGYNAKSWYPHPYPKSPCPKPDLHPVKAELSSTLCFTPRYVKLHGWPSSKTKPVTIMLWLDQAAIKTPSPPSPSTYTICPLPFEGNKSRDSKENKSQQRHRKNGKQY